ncbi:zinc ribbon domain-containing protein [Leptospira sp. GIMC2001]|uniref:zinc ribbon domain-containing protein n=1 Tax=Leptospira sp. GIMC2001 TaxID=1513297 RepID=UPI00234BB190|nr:zinc ribbon domain-containing protein [Leptospira sp. GIMC2001]WCL50397.1 zinc ribbon domain-containing protein [Leptospira sp. GIMC2001]
MDFLLYFYSFLFLLIIVTPSIFLVLRYKENSASPFGDTPNEFVLNLEGERQILISNLADLKAEQETGKMKEGEFREYSKEILSRLNDIDTNLSESKNQTARIYNKSIGDSKNNPTPISANQSNQETLTNYSQSNKTSAINFCPSCGTKSIENALFCHNCGFKFPVA